MNEAAPTRETGQVNDQHSLWARDCFIEKKVKINQNEDLSQASFAILLKLNNSILDFKSIVTISIFIG